MKLTKKILEQLIKEELTGDTALFKISKKDKKRLSNNIDSELKLKRKKFSSFVKQLPVIGRTVGNLLDIPDLMRLDQVYEEQGAEAALKELGRFALGFAPGIGELMLINDLADRYQDEKLKAITNALYMPLGGDVAKISAEKGRPRLTPLRIPRVGVNPFKESKLKQIIKEELTKLTEERKQYLCYQWWRDLEAEQPGRYKSLGREMRTAFDNIDNYDPTIPQMNAWIDKFSECPIDPSVVDIIDVDEPQ